MKATRKKKLPLHPGLIRSDEMKVVSHVQREKDEWIINTLMIEGYDVPFKYRRKKRYQDLKGARVILTYYPDVETVAGIPIEVMAVVSIKAA
jgi:hypothetical protein